MKKTVILISQGFEEGETMAVVDDELVTCRKPVSGFALGL